MPTTRPLTVRAGQPRHPDPPALADGFALHATRERVAVDGTVIPGLRAAFYRRPDGDGRRTQTLGLYTCGARELFVAWGYVGEPHCRYNAVRRHDQDGDQDGGGWYATRRGCPVLRPLTEHGTVVGVTILAGRVLVPLRLVGPAGAGR